MDLEVVNETKNDAEPLRKKARLWSANQFRTQIKTKNKVEAIQEFHQLCNNVDKEKYITEYLQQGGSCLELFQLLGSETPAVTLLEIINNILLHLIANDQVNTSVYDSCRLFLQTHLASINKMMGLGSPRKERKVILKLLTSIVTFSKKLAKEILLHVNFNSANVEVLTKQTDEKDGVRNAFIHFVMSFFIEGEYSIIFILLDKKYMLSSIFKGLRYDPPETVVLVMSTLRTYLLETTVVNKTTKMSIFSTHVVKDIVNLYNWKGLNKNDAVDLNEKQKVNASVHDFLLVLCTSHKYGVVFRDQYLGLSKKSYNNLMYTVLDSLERPWEHSYAGELVTRICGACPDLIKTMWANLKSFLEPRSTEKWLKAIKYAIILVEELQPSNIEFCIESLSVGQLIQAIPALVAPQSILKTIIPEDRTFEKPLVKLHCVSLLLAFARAVQSHCSAAQNHLNIQDGQTLKNSFNEYFYRNFLTAQELLSDWTKTDDPSYSTMEYLRIVLDLLDLYEVLCPQLLESLTVSTLTDLLNEIPGDMTLVKIRAIKLFLNYDPSILGVKSDTFEFSFTLAMAMYCKEKDPTAYTVLELLLRNVGIFDDCLEEIDVWINGFLDQSHADELSSAFVEILRLTCDNILPYISVLQNVDGRLITGEQRHCQDLLESLLDTPFDSASSLPIKNNHLSPLIIGALDYLEQHKNLKTFLNSVLINLLHLQTSPALFKELLRQKHQNLISKSVLSYVTAWADGESAVLTKTKTRLIENFNVCFLTGDVDSFYDEFVEARPTQYLHQALFYFTQLNENLLTDAHLQNCVKVCKRAPADALSVVFRHPILVQRFSPTRASVTNRFLAEIAVYSTNKDAHLKPFRSKLTTSLQAIIKKRKPVLHIVENLEVFGLDHYQSVYLIECFSKVDVVTMDGDFLLFFYNVVVYLLKNYLTHVDFRRLLSASAVTAISRLVTFLNTSQIDTSVCTELLQSLLENFPHALSSVPAELFDSIFDKNGFCKQSAALAAYLLKNQCSLLPIFERRIDKVVKAKGLILPLLESAMSLNVEDEVLQKIYEQFEPSILKGLEKPNKAGPYFDKHKEVLAGLIAKFMSIERCSSFVSKVQKFDTTEVFHVQALVVIFTKMLAEDVPDKYVHNTIVTLAYSTNLLFKKRDKSDEDWLKLDAIARISSSYYETLERKELSYRAVCENEVFGLYCNYCLKHGLSGKSEFLRTLRVLLRLLDFSETEAQKLLEMTGSHSEFLEIALGHESECKKELFNLILAFCERWPVLMQRNHVPVMLSAYHGTMGDADRTILTLLQMYEKTAARTNFYDFKPFLWGKAGATHYSVREDIQRALWRQPRMIEILEILEETKINNTICNHPLNLTLTNSNSEAMSTNENVYNLAFFLPLFGSLLVAENQVALHTFVKSGALSLTIIGLSCNNKRIRLAACHVLSRLHYHFEAKRSGKDKILRLCFIESLCRGLSTLEDFKLNNFCSIFWARMALILIHPLHAMYLPLSRYLTAKPTPDLSGIPELYTFLHVPDVNFKQPRAFILKILQDGMRTNADCSLLIFKMGFKLLMELFSSCISDLDTKISILKITERACRLNLGKEMLCGKYGLLSWLYDVTSVWGKEGGVVQLVISILTRLTEDVSKTDVNIISLIVTAIVDDGLLSVVSKNKIDLDNFLKVCINVFEANDEFLTIDRLKVLISVNEDMYCMYLLECDTRFSFCAKEGNLIQELVQKWLNKT